MLSPPVSSTWAKRQLQIWIWTDTNRKCTPAWSGRNSRFLPLDAKNGSFHGSKRVEKILSPLTPKTTLLLGQPLNLKLCGAYMWRSGDSFVAFVHLQVGSGDWSLISEACAFTHKVISWASPWGCGKGISKIKTSSPEMMSLATKTTQLCKWIESRRTSWRRENLRP